jgi:hypothetical protein
MIRRLQTTVLTIGLMAVSFCIGQATEIVKFDAAFWRGLSLSEQLAYVEGSIDGYESGYRQGRSDATTVVAAEVGTVTDRFLTGSQRSLWHQALDEDWKHRVQETSALDTPRFPQTFKTYIDAITNFYDNGGAADRGPGSILGCLSTNPPATCKANQAP